MGSREALSDAKSFEVRSPGDIEVRSYLCRMPKPLPCYIQGESRKVNAGKEVARAK